MSTVSVWLFLCSLSLSVYPLSCTLSLMFFPDLTRCLVSKSVKPQYINEMHTNGFNRLSLISELLYQLNQLALTAFFTWYNHLWGDNDIFLCLQNEKATLTIATKHISVLKTSNSDITQHSIYMSHDLIFWLNGFKLP